MQLHLLGTSTVPQSSALVSVVFNVLDQRIKCIISTFDDDTKLETAADSVEGQDALQKDLDK